MPEQQINTAKDEPVVSIPTEGDSIDVNLQEESKTEKKDETQPQVVTQETEGEELEDYSDKVKTRINKLTGKLREAERREQASFQYAKRVADENKKLKAQKNSLDNSYIQEFAARTEIETKKAETDLQRAIEANDAQAQVEANKALAKLSIDNERLLATKEAKENKKEDQEEDITPPQDVPKKIDPKAEAWAEKNPWFGKDEAMTYASFGIHKNLVEEKQMNPNSDEYYAAVDKRMREEFPHKFGANSSETTRPVQPVASAGRSTTQSTSGRKTVRLSPSQVHIAKRLGVPLEEYAKYVKE
jgi:chromosome segregation ATPase